MEQYNKEILAALMKIKNREVDMIYGCGICPYVVLELGVDTDLEYWVTSRGNIFKKWSEFSGDPFYPIPSFTDLSPEEAYHSNGVCKWEGEYGAARMRLLDFMIEEYKKLVAGE